MINKSSGAIVKLKLLAREKDKIRNELALTVQKMKKIAIEKELIRVKLEFTAKDLAYAKAVDEAMLESIGDGLLATDEKGNISFINSAAENLFNKKGSQVIGRAFSKVIVLRNEKGKKVLRRRRPIYLVLDKGAPVHNNIYYFEREDKKSFPIAITSTPIVLEGKMIGAIEVFRDITREKEIDKAKSEFISLTSHQLKNPATIVSLYTEQLLGGFGGKLSVKQEKYLNEIQKANQRMVDIINTLLNIARIEMGVFSMQVSEIDVVDFLKNSFKQFGDDIKSKNITVTENYHAFSQIISIDKSLLDMVISNLISNAMKYASIGGKISLRTLAVKKGEKIHHLIVKDDSLLISLTDDGCGIPKDQQGKIFTKFFRSDQARNQHSDGTGLGLYIVKSILDRIGGNVWFESEKNKDTVFYFTIPLSVASKKEGRKLS